MINKKLLLALVAGILSQTAMSQIEDKKGIIVKGAELVKVQDGFSFTEGPAVSRVGDVYFTDQPDDRIHVWNAISGEVSVFKENAGRSNGMYFKLDGTLISCADEQNQLWALDSKGNEMVLVENFRAKN